ncbi:MAG: hypothetical protein A2289_01105 [Deltaproteobacteria bacterium RIFOXYA12_FULL_58_15]|nr:MAG: hypothetical protein A2289_01105 [Deltaproteobacteria bacterium RIFOXYA12_FULL_58_15]OGR14728.1 MAG: hypothetical protein A2341_05115 [Deltaproteobacteria bacterium RIFOXYB12_FULL_58_9]
MKSVNALKVRTKFGLVMDELAKSGEPILLRRGNKVEAALVPIELFRKRFVDVVSEDEIRELRARVQARRVGANPVGTAGAAADSLAILRRLRGYDT